MASKAATSSTDRVAERRRAVALACHFCEAEGLSIAQIADRLGRSPATVKAHFYDALYANKRPTDSPQERQFWALAGHARTSICKPLLGSRCDGTRPAFPTARFVREQKPRGRARTAARVLLVRGSGSAADSARDFASTRSLARSLQAPGSPDWRIAPLAATACLPCLPMRAVSAATPLAWLRVSGTGRAWPLMPGTGLRLSAQTAA